MAKYAYKTSSALEQAIIKHVDLMTEVEKHPPEGFTLTPTAKKGKAKSCSFIGRTGDKNTQVVYAWDKKGQLWHDFTQSEVNGKEASVLNVIDYIAIRFFESDYTKTMQYFLKEYPYLQKYNLPEEKIGEKKVINQSGKAINDRQCFNEIDPIYEQIKQTHTNLNDNPKILEKHCYKRGLSITYVNNMKLGYYKDENNTEWLTIPYYDALGNIIYCRKRNLTNYNTKNSNYKPARFLPYEEGIPETSDHTPLWGLHTLNKRKRKTIYIAEGMVDSMVLDDVGYTVLSGSTCRLSGNNKEELFEIINDEDFRHLENITVILDNDEAGIEGAKSLVEDLLDNEVKNFSDKTKPRKNIYAVLLPEEDKDGNYIKDVADYYKYNRFADPYFEDLFLQYRFDGLSFLAYLIFKSNNNPIPEIKKLISKYSRFLPSDKIVKLLADIEYWANSKIIYLTKPQLEEIKQLTKAPTEAQLVNEVLYKYKLIYDIANGFYIFKNGYWANVEDQEVKRIIINLQGRFHRHTVTKAVFESLANICEEDAYNFKYDKFAGAIKDNIVTFTNGTLNLDTGEFFEDEYFENNYLTFKLDFDYNPEATCDKYDKFIKEVMSDSQSKVNLINEIGGYMFMKYTNYQKCFWFVGNGSNGKSTLLDVFKMIVGRNNWSGVIPSKMNDNFEVITMQDKLINIAPDINPNIADVIDILKAFVGDLTIRGCRKRKDVKDLNVFAKLIMASNDMPTIRAHTDNALERRIIFVKFAERFLDINDPNLKEDSKVINVNLIYELMAEKSGIFNRFYEGYKRIKENNGFTVPEETRNLTNEFAKESNKALAYYEAILSDEEAQKAFNDMKIGDYIIPMDYYGTTPNGKGFLSKHGLNLVYNGDREDFLEWCNFNGIEKPLSGKAFSKHFADVFVEKHPEFLSDSTTNKENRKAIIKVAETSK